ncbi:MAG: C-terminal binding protein [Lachnospiraceae bacterium]
MKVIISDFAKLMNETSEKEKRYLLEARPDWEVEIYPYEDNQKELIEKLNGADALLTAFLPLNQEMLKKMYTIKCISLNASGYNTVDLDAAAEQNIAVMAIDEYCTSEVAEHTMSLILALTRGLKRYTGQLEQKHRWHYDTGGRLRRLRGQKIGIFGFGRIGQRVAELALGFGMEVYVYDDGIHPVEKRQGIHPASLQEISSQCTIITNHMSQTKGNRHFFNKDFFRGLKREPIFINVGRGEAVEEEALVWALDEHILYGAALDVLEGETPDLTNHPLLYRDEVILTPHAAFYSEESIEALARISADNILFYMSGELDYVRRLVNSKALKEMRRSEND